MSDLPQHYTDLVPEPDLSWPRNIIEEWLTLWTDVEWAQHIRAELHIPTLRRLFTYKAHWHTTNETLKTQPALVRGSRGNEVKNPLFSELRELEKTILSMEKEFGMTLRAASLISLNLGDAELNWAELREKRKRELGPANPAKAINP